MRAISSYRGNRPTNTHKQTGPITIPRAAKLRAQCMNGEIVLAAQSHQQDAA